jgi:hypothetical protein
MENQERTNQSGKPDRGEEVFSKAVRAGKRTYFFDVKSTSKNDLFMVITESRRLFRDDGSSFYDRKKIHLYREDFDKFMEGLVEAITYARTNNTPLQPRENRESSFNENHENHSNHEEKIEVPVESKPNSFTDVNFDDLGSDH